MLFVFTNYTLKNIFPITVQDKGVSKGLAESVLSTVREREGKIKGSIYELREIIEDLRMQVVGGMTAALDKSCLVPSLLANCATWLDVKQHTVDRLDSIQDLFGRVLLQVPQSSPRLATRAALGLTGMQWHLWEEKVLLLQEETTVWPTGAAGTGDDGLAWPGRESKIYLTEKN